MQHYNLSVCYFPFAMYVVVNLAPLGCGLDLSRLNASNLKKKLGTCRAWTGGPTHVSGPPAYPSHGGGVRDRAKQSCSSDPPYETRALSLKPDLELSDLQDL
jgi:hypothetical protein